MVDRLIAEGDFVVEQGPYQMDQNKLLSVPSKKAKQENHMKKPTPFCRPGLFFPTSTYLSVLVGLALASSCGRPSQTKTASSKTTDNEPPKGTPQKSTLAETRQTQGKSGVRPSRWTGDEEGKTTALAKDETVQIQLKKNTYVLVPGTALEARISCSSHKTRAPVGRVKVMVKNGKKTAEVGWIIKSGKFHKGWKDIKGQYWNPKNGAYEHGEIPGWQARLDSIDEVAANAAPRVITISLRKRSKKDD
jgi:hypothetical protein